MDPGNWITSVVGGASYKYTLLFVILISSLIAMQLQQMAGKLGIVTRMDLAQATASRTKMASSHFMGDRRISTDGDRLSGSTWISHCLEPLVWNSNYGGHLYYGSGRILASWNYEAWI